MRIQYKELKFQLKNKLWQRSSMAPVTSAYALCHAIRKAHLALTLLYQSQQMNMKRVACFQSFRNQNGLLCIRMTTLKLARWMPLVKTAKVRRNTFLPPKERNWETTHDKEHELKVSSATSQIVSGKVISVSAKMQTNSQGYPALLCKDLGMIFHSLPF